MKKVGEEPYAASLGIRIDTVEEGRAVCSLIITEKMLNFLGVVHGGLIFSLADAGISQLAIHNRSEAKAAELARAVQRQYPGVAAGTTGTHPTDFDIALNATTVGLKPGDAEPFFIDGLRSDCLVADVIMQPLMTPLLAAARKRGLRICTGDGMLKHQLRAFAEFLGFTVTDGALAGAADGVIR